MSTPGAHPGHPNAFFEAVERLRQAIARLPGGIAAATHQAGSRVASSLPDVRLLAGAFERAIVNARRSARKQARNLGRSWDRLARNSGRRWRKYRRGLGRSGRNLGRSWKRFGRNLGKSWARRRRNLGRSWKRFGRNLGRSWRKGRRGAGRSWKRFGRNARRGLRMGLRALRSGKGPRGAGKAALAGLLGKGGADVLSAVGSVLKAGQAMKDFAERVNDSNRSLAPFSGTISSAFQRLEMGDMRRKFSLARHDEDAAAALADQVDRLRDGNQGFDKLRDVVDNRKALVAAKIVGPANKELGDIAGWLADTVKSFDPGGKKTTGFIDSIFSNTTGAVGYWMAGGIFNQEAAAKAFQESKKQWEMEQAAGKPHAVEGWDLFLASAQSMPALNPPRKWND